MKKVLIVDDEENICEILKDYLEEFELEVDTTISSIDAKKMIIDNNYDLLITDIMMPEVNGVELIEHTVENNKETKILAISGGGENKLARHLILNAAVENGAADVLMKPFTEKDFQDMVQKFI